MAKANKKANDLKSLNGKFNEISNTLTDIADSVEPLMPLLADALRFDTKIIKMYKQAFNAGLRDE